MVGPIIGGHICYRIASTTANVLLSRSEDLSLKNIKTTPMWGYSILQRLGSQRWVATTGKVDVPEKARKKALLQHHLGIVNIIEKHNIQSLVLKSDQALSKYVTVGLLQWYHKNQLVLVWLELLTSAALQWLWQSHSMEKYYHSR